MVKYRSDEALFDALANPARRKMVEQLSRRGRQSLTELAKPLKVSLPGALKHVRELERGGFVLLSKEGRVLYCTLQEDALDRAINWLDSQRRFWEQSFARLERHLAKRKKK